MLIQAGYPNAKALKGGVAAWKEAGFPMVGLGAGARRLCPYENLPRQWQYSGVIYPGRKLAVRHGNRELPAPRPIEFSRRDL